MYFPKIGDNGSTECLMKKLKAIWMFLTVLWYLRYNIDCLYDNSQFSNIIKYYMVLKF